MAHSSHSLWEPLKSRDFTLVWGGFMVSHIGDSMQLHAQAWLVTELSRSGLASGTVALAQALPRLVLGIFAGVWIDRVERRKLLLVTQTLAMLQAFTLWFLVWSSRVTLGRVLVLAVCLGIFDSLNLNARMALMPSLVPRAVIPKAIALQALGVNLVQILGPALTGAITARVGIQGCMLFNVGTFLVLLVALFFLRDPSAEPRGKSPSIPDGGLREGFRFVRERPTLWAGILLAYLLGLFGVGFIRLLALFARVTLQLPVESYGILASCTGAGAILASVFVTARASASALPKNVTLFSLLFSASLFALPFVHGLYASGVVLGAMGFGQMASRSALSTVLQSTTPDRLRGRVSSLLTLDFSLWSVGALLMGLAADALARQLQPVAALRNDAVLSRGLAWTLVCSSVVCFFSTLALSPTILRKPVSPQEAPQQ